MNYNKLFSMNFTLRMNYFRKLFYEVNYFRKLFYGVNYFEFHKCFTNSKLFYRVVFKFFLAPIIFSIF